MKTTLFILACLAAAGGLSAQVIDQVDWESFLSRHDMVWKRLPDRFENAAFTGNGHLGAMVFSADEGQAIKWQMGRSDVAFGTTGIPIGDLVPKPADKFASSEMRSETSRIPIGDLILKPAGRITAAEMRLDLWNAEVRGKITTDQGEIEFRTFTHSIQMVNVFETICRGGEKATWTWSPGPATEPRKTHKKEPLTDQDRNDPPQQQQDGDTGWSFQPLRPGGGHTTAWKIVETGDGRATVFAAVGYASSETASKAEALEAVKKAAATGTAALGESHRAWWHNFWPDSFVSVPDTRIESFYHIQFYKMASATRPGRPALDLLGPWFRSTPWPKIWWNLNIQLTYWPQLTANRLDLGESLCELIDQRHEVLAQNAGPFAADSAFISRATGYDCRGGDGRELCNLPWTMHNYWLQYRYSMDEAKLRSMFPMLKRSINYYLHLLEEGPDGKLHISRGLSPEYEGQPNPNPDCNIDLALLRWGCQTLLETCALLKLDDPLIPRWNDTLARLTPYPRDKNGLMISASVPFEHSHRHYSHLLMIYPLYIMTPEQPENRALVTQSLQHWMGMPQALAGYSYTGAASISALLEDGNEAANYLNKLLDSKKVPPNTLYVEAGPCIETPLSAAASVNDMLLSSWGDRIRVFPGAPAAWQDISFHNLRTQGAFLVSAARKDGKTHWVRIKSLAGEKCRIRPGLEGPVKATVPLQPADNGAYDLTLAKGEEAILYTGDSPPACTVAPVATEPNRCNFYGLP